MVLLTINAVSEEREEVVIFRAASTMFLFIGCHLQSSDLLRVALLISSRSLGIMLFSSFQLSWEMDPPSPFFIFIFFVKSGKLLLHSIQTNSP
jgi:hypothetical protein